MYNQSKTQCAAYNFFIWAVIHFVLASMLMMVLVHHFQLFSLSSLVQHFKNFSSKLPLFASSRHPPLWRSRNQGAHGVQNGASPPLFWIPFHADHGLRVLVPSLFNPPPNQTLAPIALYCGRWYISLDSSFWKRVIYLSLLNEATLTMVAEVVTYPHLHWSTISKRAMISFVSLFCPCLSFSLRLMLTANSCINALMH